MCKYKLYNRTTSCCNITQVNIVKPQPFDGSYTSMQFGQINNSWFSFELFFTNHYIYVQSNNVQNHMDTCKREISHLFFGEIKRGTWNWLSVSIKLMMVHI